MRAIRESPIWKNARLNRKRQKIFGWISGILFAIALVGLFDGLLAQMRTGSNELNLLRGQSIILSGPAALKNPVTTDVRVRFTPEDAPLSFELEGFFTGYWFGSGMWRGQVTASQNAEPGVYEMRLSFRGASASNAQKYIFSVFENAGAMRAASLSFIQRLFNMNPFILASSCGGMALFFGLLTYWFGRRFDSDLGRLGLAQIWSMDGPYLSCLASVNLAPRPGVTRMILDQDAHLIGQAQIESWKKGKLFLKLVEPINLEAGLLVCLKHPEDDKNLQAPANSLFHL